MKKLMTLTLTAAVATSMIDVPTVMAEDTTVTTPVSVYTDMKLMEVKDGQFDENGEAYFTLTIEQEGFYRLVGDNIDQYKTAITQNKEQLENATFQSASKLRILKKGTYYVKVKGTPNATYHFKFAERTFDMDQEWPISKKIAIPYYMEREAYATLELKDDKYIRFMGHSATSDKAVKALSLKNVTTGETYIAKKISNYAFSSNAPDGTYHVDLVYTDEFKKNPIVGKLELRYTLAEHLPFNERVSSKTTAGETFTLNLEKDTKIHFTLMDLKGKKGNNQRFSIYDDQHRLVKRVHIQRDQASRTFTYTVKKGRYSVSADNTDIEALVKNVVDTNTKFKLKNNVLVHADTGKVVKGYQVYKEKLYKDGVLATGRVKYGKVPNMKLYRNGILEQGLYIAKDYKYAFKDGSLIKGNYTYETEIGVDAIFKDGVLTHLMELKDNTLYDNGKIHRGRYVLNTYAYDENEIDGTYLQLFINGKLATGYEEGTYQGETYMFKNGVTGESRFGFGNFYYDGKVYENGKPKSGYASVGDTLYYDHQLFTGTLNDRYYEKGRPQYYVMTKTYEQKVADTVALKSEIGHQSDEAVAQLLKEKTTNVLAYLDENESMIYDDYGHEVDDGIGSLYYDDPLNIARTIGGQLQQIDDVATQLGEAALETHELLQQRLKEIYKEFDLYYDNGALLDGEYEGNVYEDGELIGAALNIAYNETQTTFLTSGYGDIVKQKDEQAIKAQLQDYVDAVTKNINAANAIVKASQNPDYPKVDLYKESATSTINDSMKTFRFIKNVMNTYNAEANLAHLQEAMTVGFALLDKAIDFNELDEEAVYQDMKLLDVQDGTFDDKGYAYFKVDLTAAAGNYTFAGNDDVKSYTTFTAENPENVEQSQQLGATELRYLEKGTYYMAVKGQPNQSYHFKLKRRTYDVETMNVLNAASSDYDRTNVVKVPIYQTNQPNAKINLTANQHIQFLALPSDTTVIDALELTNEQTGKTYTAKKQSAYRFETFALKGTYSVSIKSSSPSIGQHVALRYFVSPTLTMNQTWLIDQGVHGAFTFVTANDTKTQFTLSTQHGIDSSKNQTFKLYNDQHELVKKVTLKKGDKTRTFTYTVKKGNYYVRLNGADIQVTATLK